MKMNKKTVSLAALAGALVLGIGVKPAMAYFTDYKNAYGSVTIHVTDPHNTITEEGEGQQKVIVLSNTENDDCYARVTVILPEGINASVDAQSSAHWSQGSDGYYYYDTVLTPAGSDEGNATEALILNIDTTGAVSTGDGDFEDFNVVVVPEATKVLYDEAGNSYANWNTEATYTNTVTTPAAGGRR